MLMATSNLIQRGFQGKIPQLNRWQNVAPIFAMVEAILCLHGPVIGHTGCVCLKIFTLIGLMHQIKQLFRLSFKLGVSVLVGVIEHAQPTI